MLRVWVEFLSARELAAHLDLLARRRISPCLAVEGWSPDLGSLLKGCAARGLEPGLWPLLPLEQGYFPNERNLEPFGRLLSDLVHGAETAGAEPAWMVFDLEPPLDRGVELLRGPPLRRFSRLVRWPLETLRPERFEAARRRLEEMVRRLRRGGWRTLCAAAPFLLDQPEGTAGLEDLLESPVLGVGFDRVSFMLYSSMLPGPGGPGGNPAWVHSYAREARRRLGGAAAVSLGVTGRGVLEVETLMAGPEVLARDVGAARAAGIEDVALYNLEGSLRDPEGWLGALRAPAQEPRESIAVEASRAAVRAGAVAAEWGRKTARALGR
ncbi:MAG: hypothetical protein QXO51_05070 [Halobacteria archaeon]